MTQPAVTFNELPAGNNYKIGIATLNAEKSLNALSLAMIDLLQARLSAWERDADIACVFLQGAGDKAFCAGGDVVALYAASAAYGEALDSDYALQFFSREYRLDYHIHTYTKPILAWGQGIVMGGGMGLLSGASHRVVTETTRMAMPEVTIGLYPDVGGTWFLNHAPGQTGLFLGLTGASFNAADAKFVGLGDRFLPHACKDQVLAGLADIDWRGEAQTDRESVTALLRDMEAAHLAGQPDGQLEPHLDWINATCAEHEVPALVSRITAYEGDDTWLAKAARGLAAGCPITPHLVAQQLRRGSGLSLADVFRMEFIMSVNCAARGHFREGVRALLIDKDRAPRWRPDRVEAVSAQEVAAFFQAPWDGPHPLADLGQIDQ
ncbi:enoyl-CoA hydratase/isomerase family protein [Exilibacterium tricleocarpae]|uniref:enoyl-CoA hydratase/isomerase family protein n=1 Tax=Exilibacterium tricleocarpae TaxID=2591008 RepID=UPI001FE524D0|nr:enoyl-CoA hydratase/isomerase family protein [Exilibacterium tricleocarpae]